MPKGENIIASRFKDEPSEAFIKAHDALLDLMDDEGIDSVRRVFASVMSKVELTEFCERNSLSECNEHTGIEGMFAAPNDYWEDRVYVDHPSVWCQNGEFYVYVAQPYELQLYKLKELVDICEAYDLNVEITAHGSWHFPSATLCVKIYRRGSKLVSTLR